MAYMVSDFGCAIHPHVRANRSVLCRLVWSEPPLLSKSTTDALEDVRIHCFGFTNAIAAQIRSNLLIAEELSYCQFDWVGIRNDLSGCALSGFGRTAGIKLKG